MRRKLIVFIAVVLLLCAVSVSTVFAQMWNLPWGVERIRGDLPWDEDGDLIVDPDANAGQNISVAIIDSGIANHPDLDGRVVDGISYVEGKDYWEDDVGHGTHIAGTIAGIDDGDHLIGVAPRVDLYAVKVEVDPPNPTEVAYGISWAVSKGVHIISMSLWFAENHTILKLACDYAYSEGVLLIAGSGNTGDFTVIYPAKYESVVAVGAVDQNDQKAPFSNTGSEMELAAPGVDINSTFPPNTYRLKSGTSMAVPHVSGTAALVFGSKVDSEYDSNNNWQWDNFEVRKKLNDTVLNLGNDTGWDSWFGCGLVNAWFSNQRPPGDITYDLRVDMRDIAYVSKHYGKTDEDPDWWGARVADVNIDNTVDLYDLHIVGQHYGEVDP